VLQRVPQASHEVRLVQQTLNARSTDEAPGRLVGDKAHYDGAALGEDLAEQGIEFTGKLPLCSLRSNLASI